MRPHIINFYKLCIHCVVHCLYCLSWAVHCVVHCLYCLPCAVHFAVYCLYCLPRTVSCDVHRLKKSRIRETSNLSTDADRRTDTILESLRDLSRKRRRKKMGRFTRPRTHPSFLGLHACNKMDAWAMDALHPPLVFRAPRV